MKENRAGEKPVRLSFLCILPFQQYKSGSDQRQHEVKMYNRIVYTNYAVPTGNLDSVTGMEVIGLLKIIAERFYQTILVVTHNEEIAQMAERIIRIEDGKVTGDSDEK